MGPALSERFPLILAMLCAGCSKEPRTSADLRIVCDGPAVIPLVSSSPLAIRGAVDGHSEFEFIVDTGADMSCISRRNATKLGLTLRPYSRPGSTTGANGKRVAYEQYAIVRRFESGPLQLEDWVLPVFESEIADNRPDCGLMGQDVLGRLVIVVDAERSQLHVLPPSIDREGISKYLGEAQVSSGDWIVLDNIVYRPTPFLDLQLGLSPPVDFGLAIDTGATNTSFPKGAIEALHLEETTSYEGSTISGPNSGHNYTLGNMTFFGLHITGEVQDGSLEYGLVGMDILSQLVFVIDAPGKAVWLHKRANSHSKD